MSAADPGSQMICDEICFAATGTSLIRRNTFQSEPNQVFLIHQFSTGDQCCDWAFDVGLVPLIGDWGFVIANRISVITQGSVSTQDPDFIWNQFDYGEYALPMEFSRLASPQPNPAPGTLGNLTLGFIASVLTKRQAATRHAGSGRGQACASKATGCS